MTTQEPVTVAQILTAHAHADKGLRDLWNRASEEVQKAALVAAWNNSPDSAVALKRKIS